MRHCRDCMEITIARSNT